MVTVCRPGKSLVSLKSCANTRPCDLFSAVTRMPKYTNGFHTSVSTAHVRSSVVITKQSEQGLNARTSCASYPVLVGCSV